MTDDVRHLADVICGECGNTVRIALGMAYSIVCGECKTEIVLGEEDVPVEVCCKCHGELPEGGTGDGLCGTCSGELDSERLANNRDHGKMLVSFELLRRLLELPDNVDVLGAETVMANGIPTMALHIAAPLLPNGPSRYVTAEFSHKPKFDRFAPLDDPGVYPPDVSFHSKLTPEELDRHCDEYDLHCPTCKCNIG